MPLAEVLDSRKGRMAILSRPKNDTSTLPLVVVHVFHDRRSHMRFLAFHPEVSDNDRGMVAWFISAAAKTAFKRRPPELWELHVRSFLFQ